MKLRLFGIALILGVAMVFAGCASEQAAENEMEETGGQMSETTEEAGESTSEGVGDMTAAATLTPEVKSAIIADDMLNDDANEINVDSEENTVYLRGHVASQELKDRAEEVAEKRIADDKDHGEGVEVVNELEVRTGAQ